MDALLRRRGPVLILALLLTGAMLFFASGLEFSTSPETILETSDEELARLRQHEALFGTFERRLLLVCRADDVFAPSVLERLADATARLSDLPSVRDVRSLARTGFPLPDPNEEPAAFRRAVLGNRLLTPSIVSENGTATLLLVELNAEGDTARSRPKSIEACMAAARAAGLDPLVTGVPAVRKAYADFIRDDLTLLPALVALILAVMLFLAFRNVWHVIGLLASVGIAGVWTLGILSLTGGRITALTSILPALLMVVGVAGGVHVVSAFREEQAEGKPPRLAARAAILRMALPCGITAVTTAVGFSSLVVAGIRDVREFGLYSSVGALLTFLLGVPLVGVVLSFGRGRVSAPVPFGPSLRRLGILLRRRPAIGYVAGAAITVLSLAGLTRLDSQMFLLEDIRSDSPIHTATLAVDREFGGLIGFDLVVEAPDSPLEPATLEWLVGLEAELAALPDVSVALGPGTLVAESRKVAGLPPAAAPAPLVIEMVRARGGEEMVRSFLAPGAGFARVLVRTGDVGSRRSAQIVETALELARSGAPEGVEIRIGGLAIQAEQILSRLVTEMGKSLVIAFVTIFLLMSLIFKSLRVGALSMVPNFFPLLAAGGFMGVAGITIRSSIAMIFAVGLGIAVDDTVHLLTRYLRERSRGRRTGRAVSLAIRWTGRPVILTSAVLFVGFASFLTSSFKATYQFGMIAAVTIAAALVGDLLILPALLVLRPPRIGGGQIRPPRIDRSER